MYLYLETWGFRICTKTAQVAMGVGVTYEQVYDKHLSVAQRRMLRKHGVCKL